MKINLKEVSVFLSAILLARLVSRGSRTHTDGRMSWSCERVDKLPEYRTGSYVEQFSSYDRTGRAMMMVLRVLILSFVRKVISW